MARKVQPVEPVLRGNLLALARAFADARGIKLTTVAQMARTDGAFFNMLATSPERSRVKHASFTVRKYDELVGWFSANWPKGAPMPKLNSAAQ
jgi:hypothetical protein